MKKLLKKAKKRNPQDATMRNVRALSRRILAAEEHIEQLRRAFDSVVINLSERLTAVEILNIKTTKEG